MSLESAIARVGELQALLAPVAPADAAPASAPAPSPVGASDPGGESSSFRSALGRAQASQSQGTAGRGPGAPAPAGASPPDASARGETGGVAAPSPGGGPSGGVAAPAPGASGDGRASGAFAWPVRAPVTSGFGPRWGRQHSGIDLGAAQGTPVKAAAGGRVKTASSQGGYGNLVTIEHPGGKETRYAHLASIGVRVGDTVAAGEVVGRVGSTGNSTGPHLHFEVRVDGRARDPRDVLPRR